jgi:hypothetical protein
MNEPPDGKDAIAQASEAAVSRHLSTFELDVHWASGRPAGEVETHVTGCDPCRGYLAGLGGLARSAPPPPANIVAIAGRRARGSARSWALPLAGGLAFAAGVLFYLHRTSRPDAYVASKGTPAVELLVERGHSVSRWNEHLPIHPLDRLALRVACEDFAHVTVTAPDGPRWARVYDDACTGGATPLPFSLVVDQQPGDEHLVVVLSRAALDDEALARAIAGEARGRDAWTLKLDLAKVDPAP